MVLFYTRRPALANERTHDEGKLPMMIQRTPEHTTKWMPGGKPSGAMYVCALELSNGFNQRLGNVAIDRRYRRQ